MGPSRARSDDPNHSDPFGKRPSLFDTHHLTRKSATGEKYNLRKLKFTNGVQAPEDLVLGPPKTTFSSSNARTFGRSPPSKDAVNDESRGGEKHSTYDKFRKNGEGDERDSERRDTRFSAHGGRRLREDREGWELGRQRRHIDGEDRERKPKRNGMDRFDTREPKGQLSMGSESRLGKEEEGKHPARSDGDRRARFQQPWFKSDQSRDMAEDAASRPNHWRKEGGGGPKIDQNLSLEEPEWLDPNEAAKTQQVHTQEDFQRWKEQMKAGAQRSDRDAENAPQDEPANIQEVRPADIAYGALDSDEAVTPSIDSFFGMFTAAAKSKAPAPSSGEGKEKEKPNSRFKSLFSPTTAAPESTHDHELQMPSVESNAQIPANSASPPPASESADQEGFQRILQMLGGRSKNATPQENTQEQSNPDIHASTQPLLAGLNMQSPDTFQSTTVNHTHSRNSGGLESLLPPISPGRIPEPVRKSGNSRDTEMLLRLMKQASINDNANQEAIGQARDSSEKLGYGRSHRPSQVADAPFARSSRGTSSGFSEVFDDPRIVEARSLQRDAETLRQTSESAPQRRPFDEAILNRLAMNQPTNARAGSQPAGPTSLPPSMARFSTGGGNSFAPQAPPGWPNQHSTQPPLPQHVPPNAPPGIPNPPNRGPNPSFPPMLQNMNQPQVSPIDRSQKYTSGLPYGQQGPPPGMGFPPGFINNGNPTSVAPQGFPQITHAPVENHLFPGRGVSGGRPPTILQGSGNLMDFFASGPDSRNGGRGGSGFPNAPPYR